jgi:hypothetical protein
MPGRHHVAIAYRVLLIGLTGAPSAGAAGAGQTAERESGLIGYWKLSGDCGDHSGSGIDGTNHGVTFDAPEPFGGTHKAARFDGLNHYIDLGRPPAAALGKGDFSVSVWVKTDENVSGVVGDILNQFDPLTRKGFNLHVSTSSPGYSGLSNTRLLQFGIDDARTGRWVDCGRPWPGNTLVSTLVVYDGSLYTGIADAKRPEDACHFFRYGGGTTWVDCGRVSRDLITPSVYSVCVHKGRLYAGTGAWDWERAWKGEGATGRNHVYRYEGGTEWHDCGRFGEGYRVLSLCSYKGDLYATDDKGASYRYDGDNKWAPCGRVGGKIYSTTVYQGRLYGGENTRVYCYDPGKGRWDNVAETLYDENQVHTLAVYQGSLYAGAWPLGRILRYDGNSKWADCGWVGIDPNQHGVRINEVNDLTVYNGKLYAGVIPRAQVWRYEGGRQWTLIRQLVDNPQWDARSLPSWNRVPCVTVFEGRLYAGTSTCHGRHDDGPIDQVGRVYSFEAGRSVSFDRGLGADWTHIAAVRAGDRLKLYVNGRLVAASAPMEGSWDITNQAPLRIGFGCENYFSGAMCELRLYRRALTEAQVLTLSRWPG